MIKIKFCIPFLLSIFIVFFPVLSAFSQEGIAPPDGGLTAPAPYVKPGNVTMNFKNADIRAVLLYLSEVSGVDIIPAPEVTGVVTLKLTDKPWQVALNIIAKNYGYAYDRDGDIIRVVTLESLKLEELSTEVVPLNYASAEIAEAAVKDMLTPRGKMTFDARVNALVITDLATNIYKMKQIIQDLDKKTPQIMIEAKIIETTLNDTERLGINWNLVIAASGASRPVTLPFANWMEEEKIIPRALENFYPFVQTTAETGQTLGGGSNVVTTTGVADFTQARSRLTQFPIAEAGAFTYGTLDFTQFGAVMEYLKSRSDTDIISNPRITTLNNKEAKMFVGKVYNYISEVEQKEDATGSTARWTYKIDKEEIGIRLLVTPHINEIGDIRVELKPEIKDVVGFQNINQYFSLPIFTTREAETQVLVKDGNTIFIGGLIKENITKYNKKFPILGDLLGDVPIIGNAFKYETETKEKTELIFFLTVHVVKDLKKFNALGAKDVVEIEIPMDIKGAIDFPITENAVIEPKKIEPLLDFRKIKEQKNSQ